MTEPAVSARELQLTHEPVASLRPYHRNPRRGDVAALRRSLAVNGQYRPLVVNRGTHTGRAGEVLAGNHTLAAASAEGWPDVAVVWVDVDDEQAARIVTADNRLGDLGAYDDAVLVDLLKGLPDYDGTGYTDDQVDDLAAALEEQVAALAPSVPFTAPRGLSTLGDFGGGDDDGAPVERPAPPSRDEGMLRTYNMFDTTGSYIERDDRQLVLTYTLSRFEWVIGHLTALADRYGVDSNTEAVAHMIAEVTGDQMP